MSLKHSFLGVAIFVTMSNLQAQENLIKTPYFEKITVTGGLIVTYCKSDSLRIVINGEDKNVVYSVKNKKLKIKNKKLKNTRNNKATILVYGNSLNEVNARAGAIVKSGKNTLADTTKIVLASGSEFYTAAENKKIVAKMNRGSFFEYTGQTKDFNLKVKSGAKFRGNKAKIEQANIKANTGGFAALDTKISGKALFWGEIKVYGKQQSNNIKKTIWGRITEGDEYEL